MEHAEATSRAAGDRPVTGFRQLWQKTYQVSIPGPSPEEIISAWKANFGEFWYPPNKFYAPAAGIAPGEITVIAGGRGPTKVTTGVRVIYADETSWFLHDAGGAPVGGDHHVLSP